MKSFDGMYGKIKPFLIATLLQLGFAGMSIICKFALNKGMSPLVFAVYRHAVATIIVAPFAIVQEREFVLYYEFIFELDTQFPKPSILATWFRKFLGERPKMILSTFVKILLLGLLKPIENNLYYTGMKCTTATFAAAMANISPALVFFMAWIFRLEKISIRKVHSQTKIMGTIVTIAGAMLMTSVKGPRLGMPWTKANYNDQETGSSTNMQHPIKGALCVAISCLLSSSFIILQAITLKSYPAELSLTALICLMGTIEGTALALVMGRGNIAGSWSIHLDYKLLAAVYSGVINTGLGYYLQGAIMKERGPVFVAAFTPLCMVIVAIMGSILLAEIMHLGRVIGAIVIVLGLYLFLWGKSKDQTSSRSECCNKVALPSDHQMVRMGGGVVGTLNKDMGEESTAGLDQEHVKAARAHESV